MAISIISNFTSGRYYPSSNPINCTVNSNNSGKCNFRYICDVYVNGTKVFTDKLFPDPNTGYAFFQLSRVIQDYIETSLPKTPYLHIINPATNATGAGAAISVYCRFGEEYDQSTTCDGQVSQYLNLGTSNTFNVFETAIPYEDFPTFDYTDYLVGTASSTKKFLTNSPREMDITYNDSYFLDFITNTTITGSFSVNVEAFSATGSVVNNNYTRNLGTLYRRVRLAVGPYDINNYDNDVTIGANITYYTVKLKWANNTLTETFRFNVRKPKTFRTRLSFIGLMGSPESYTFYHRNRSTYNIDRKTYQKTLQSNYSNQWKYEVGDRSTSTFAISANETHTVGSFVEREVSEWLTEMWLSPEVWTYRRPELVEFRPFKQGSYVYYFIYGDHNIEVGDYVFSISSNPDYENRFLVTFVDGQTIGLNMLYSIYGATMEGTCGFVLVDDAWNKLPISISDNTVEVKQKLTRPIEYQLNYAMAYQKMTLRP